MSTPAPLRVVTVSVEELGELVEAAVRRALERRPVNDASDEYVSAAAAADLLKVHPRTVARLAHDGEIPSARVGRRLRFKRSDVLAYLERA